MPRHLPELEALTRFLRPTPDARPAKPIVVFTFDDNPAADFTAIKPILDAKAVKGTFCAVTSWVGNGASVTWAQLQQLQAEGHEINNHSATHAGLVGASAAALKSEVVDSHATFVANGIRPSGYTYPGGPHDAAARAEVRKMHSYALSIGTAANTQPLKSYAFDRRGFDNATVLADHQAQVDAAVAGNALLIYVVHAATLDAAALTKLETLIDYITAANVTITTMAKALDTVGNIVDTGDYPTGKYTVVDGSGQVWSTNAVINSLTGTGTYRFKKGAGANQLEIVNAIDIMKWTVADALLCGYASDGSSVRLTLDTADTPANGRFNSALFSGGKHASFSNVGVEVFAVADTGAVTCGAVTSSGTVSGIMKPKSYTTAGRPSAATSGAGAEIYDSTLNRLLWSDGTNWRDALNAREVNTAGLTSAQIDALFTATPADGQIVSDPTNGLLLVRQAGKWAKTAALTVIA